jgi:hypothetical protein
MNALEFTTDLRGDSALQMPSEIAAQLPKTGKARVIILTTNQDDSAWFGSAYEQFLRDDAPQDAIYDSLG